jgi:hypothetical protein
VILRRLRFSRGAVQRVDRLLRVHPIETQVQSLRDAELRRLVKRAQEDNLAALFLLRRAEIDAGVLGAEGEAVRERLASLEMAIERIRRGRSLALRRFDLALDGQAVMEQLGCDPGPEVGRALAYLTERVLDEPECNTEAGLGALLDRFIADESAG